MRGRGESGREFTPFMRGYRKASESERSHENVTCHPGSPQSVNFISNSFFLRTARVGGTAV